MAQFNFAQKEKCHC